MSNKINKSHYTGIAAEWYDDLLHEEKKDTEYYSTLVKENGGPALEIACGTGRNLIPIAEAGIEIDGVDSADEMLQKCRTKIEAKNLPIELFQQDMADLKINKKYKTIIIPGGSFQLLTDFDVVRNTLLKIKEHLLSDGKFILDTFIPIAGVNLNEQGAWQNARTAARENGENLCVFSSTKYDIGEQLMFGKYKYELYNNKLLQQTYYDEITLRWYGKYEFKMLLEQAGFNNVIIDVKNVMSVHGNSFVYFAGN